MEQKLKQRIGGVVLISLGTAFTVYGWHEVSTNVTYYAKAAFLFPIDRRALLEKFEVERPSSLAHCSSAPKIFFVLALAAGGLNCALISGTLAL